MQDSRTGKRTVMVSSIPLTAKTTSGALAPLNLGVIRTGTSFAPSNPLVPMSIGTSLAAGVTFPNEGFGFKLVASGSDAPISTPSGVFYPNVGGAASATDFQVNPAPSGAEVDLQIRAASSPERFVLKFSLPAGAKLEPAHTAHPIPGDPPTAIEVANSAGDPLGFVYQPSAFDAAGTSVPATATIAGDTVILTVSHRGMDLQYPVLVDPLVAQQDYFTQYGAAGFDWPGWSWEEVDSFYNQQFPPYQLWTFGQAIDNSSYWPGLYTSMPSNNPYASGNFAEFTYPAPANTYIAAASYLASHNALTSPGPTNQSFFFMGLSNASGYESGVYNYTPAGTWVLGNPALYYLGFGTTSAALCFSGCSDPRGSEGTLASLGIEAYSSNGSVWTGSGRDSVTASAATISLGDIRPPTVTSPAPAGSTGWVNDHGQTYTGTAVFHDDGLGLQSVTVPGTNGTPATKTEPACGDPYRNPCPRDDQLAYSYTLPEGITNLQISDTDIAGNTSSQVNPATGAAATTQNWTMKIDRTAPSVAVSGPAYDARTQMLASGTLALTVAATDQSSAHATSGVTSIQTLVDGQVVAGGPSASQPCSQGGCALSASGTVDFDALSAGAHTVEVRVTDAAGNVSETDWGVVTGLLAGNVTRSIGDCWTGGTSPTMPFPVIADVGSVFDSLDLTDVSLGCNPDPSAVAAANSDAVPNTVPFVNMSFGTCQTNANQEGGCAPPLDVQFWPECARNEDSYSVPTGLNGADQLMANTDIALDQLAGPLLSQVTTALSQESWLIPAALSPSLTLQLSEIPAASYEDGTRIEIYTGTTTVVIFADDPTLANLAVAALSLKVAIDGIQISASTLASNALGAGCYS